MVRLLFLFLLIPSISFSQIKGFVEVGKDLDFNIAYTELQIGYNIKFWNISLMPYGNQKTWFEHEDFEGFPFQEIYKVGTELKFENITIDLSHFCSHQIVTDHRSYIYDYKPPEDGKITKLSIRYDF